MKVSLLALAVFGLLVSSPAFGSPSDARYAEDADDLFWFLVVADLHVGENLWGGTQDTDNLKWVAGEAFEVVRPAFVFACGDLTDATGGLLIPTGQHDSEWSEYRGILDAAGMTFEQWIDLPGNHDQYCDKGLTHYLKYSIQGSHDGMTQHSITLQSLSGYYHFLTVATPANDGACWPADNAGLDPAELDFIKASFENKKDARLHFAFGHHGVKYGESNKVGEGAKDFLDFLKKYQVVAYFWGHTHSYFSEFHDGTLFFNVRSLGKSEDKNVALAAVDHDSLSVRAFTARKWPFVLVTAPADFSLGGKNPYAYLVPRGWKEAPVRALVLSKDKAASVVFQIDGGEWHEMVEVKPGVYQGHFDPSGLSDDPHKLRVRANPWPDMDHLITFFVGDLACSNGIDDDGDGLTDFPFDIGCYGPADPDEFNEAPPQPDLFGQDGQGQGEDVEVEVEEAQPLAEEVLEGASTNWAEVLSDPGQGGEELSLNGEAAASWESHDVGAPTEERDAPETPPSDLRQGKSGGGCGAGSKPQVLWPLLVLMIYAILAARQRR